MTDPSTATAQRETAYLTQRIARLDDYRLAECASWGNRNQPNTEETALLNAERERRADILTPAERRWSENYNRTMRAFSGHAA